MRSCPTRLLIALVVSGVAVLCRAAVGSAEPSVPADDAVVLERLPAAALDARGRRLRALSAELARRPDNLALAIDVAWRCIEQGRAMSDPRYFGHAQSALAPWWSAAEPPLPVMVLRATIRQRDHDFAAALHDLGRALRADPDNAQAWLTQAVVRQVRGEYRAAARSCLELPDRAAPLVAVTCLSGVESLSGAAATGYERLRRTLLAETGAGPETRRWALTVLAEVAARRGDRERAEAHFRAALAAGGADDYLRGAYADFLLDQGRAAEVRGLLDGAAPTDGALLRLAIADTVIGAPERAARVRMLRDRFAAARLRGDAAHQREEARFALSVLGDPAAALTAARSNWAVQREPWDARLLLEAALAAGKPGAARPVVRFLARSRLEDARLSRLAAQLSAVSS